MIAHKYLIHDGLDEIGFSPRDTNHPSGFVESEVFGSMCS